MTLTKQIRQGKKVRVRSSRNWWAKEKIWMLSAGTLRRRRILSTLQILLVRFNKSQEIFPSVTRVLSILLTAAATSASVERVNSKERVTKVLCSMQAASYAQRRALCSNNPANIQVSVKRVKVVERIWGYGFPLHLLPCESWIFAKEKPDRKKKETKKANYALQHVRADSRCMWMMSVFNL